MSQTLETYFGIFLSVSAVLLIIISVFLIKWLIELSKLTSNITDITTVIKSDLEPTVKELQETLKSVNAIMKEADKNVANFKGIATKVLGASSIALTGLKGLTDSFWKGMAAGFKFFRK